MIKLREPSSVVEMAEMCRLTQQRLLTLSSTDADGRATAQGVLSALREADFYQIEAGVGQAVETMFETLFSGKDTEALTLDKDCRLPSKVCAFWSLGTKVQFTEREEEFPFMYLAAEEDDGIFVYLVSPYFSAMAQGGYQLEVEGSLVGPDNGTDEDRRARAVHVLTVASMCSVLNQPSFTIQEPAGSRQERRAAKRSGSYASDAWYKITWNIGEAVKTKLTRDDPVRCMPLHYTRGHWRKAQEGWINTTRRKDGLWYQWIEGFWSGHPAFGIKKSYHTPKISGF